jgi:hypothetical protein
VRIYLATWAEDNQGKGLNDAGNKNRLMSFFFLKKEDKEYLKKYVARGMVDRTKK